MMTTVNEVSNDKTKVLNEFSFRSVALVRFTAELDKQIDSQYTYMQAYYLNYGCIRVCIRTDCVFVFMFPSVIL